MPSVDNVEIFSLLEEIHVLSIAQDIMTHYVTFKFSLAALFCEVRLVLNNKSIIGCQKKQ